MSTCPAVTPSRRFALGKGPPPTLQPFVQLFVQKAGTFIPNAFGFSHREAQVGSLMARYRSRQVRF